GSRPTSEAGRFLPPARVAAISPSSASASSAVTISPVFHTNPEDTERWDRTVTTEGVASATRVRSDADSASKGVRLAVALMGPLQNGDPTVRMPERSAYCPDG